MNTQRIGCNWVLNFSKHKAPDQLTKLVEHDAQNHLLYSMILEELLERTEVNQLSRQLSGQVAPEACCGVEGSLWTGSARTDLGSSVVRLVTLAIAKVRNDVAVHEKLEFPKKRHDGRDLASPIRRRCRAARSNSVPGCCIDGR